MKGFIEFIRSQGVIGLAVGFIMGGSITKLITAFVNDIINPIVGIFMGAADLQGSYLQIGSAKIMWGDFVSSLVDFIIIAFIVYFSVKVLGVSKLDKGENKK
ncbi:MAG: MscL family protein [Candidatus Shapirobacteria bacterium]|nr:MscL family protein [Candidatus Shapirobacteria bacterium]